MQIRSLIGGVILAVLGSPVHAEWAMNMPEPVGTAEDPAIAFFSPAGPVTAVSRNENGYYRVFASLPGAPLPVIADEGITADHRRPVLVPNGTGGGALIYCRFTGTAWHLFARAFNGAVFTDMNSGNPIDTGRDFSAMVSAGAYLPDGRLVVAFVQSDSTKMALYAAEYNPGTGVWSIANGGAPLDSVHGAVDSVSVARASDGKLVVAYNAVAGGDLALFAVSYDGAAWSALNGGEALDRADLYYPTRPVVAGHCDGAVALVYLEEDADGVSRIYGLILNGALVTRLNGGAPLDSSPKGVASLSAASIGKARLVVAYGTSDQVDRSEPYGIESFLLNGTTVAALNGGDALQTQWEGGTLDVAVAGTSSGNAGLVYLNNYSRCAGVGQFLSPASTPATCAANTADQEDSVSAIHNIFRPDQGERVRVVCSISRAQKVRVAIYTVSGGLVRMLEDGPVNPGYSSEWDGSNGRSERVSAGVYILVAQGDTFKSTSKVVVVR